MSQRVLEYSSTAPQTGEDIAGSAARGFVWLTAQTLGAKVISMLGQVVLAWFLIPEDFGLFGMAMTVLAFTAMIQQAGLKEILIYRHRKYERWANSAFWMAVALGVLSGAVLAASAPVAAHFYRDPRVVGLILVLAATAPLSGLDVVADARLQSELRFGTLATANLCAAAAQLICSVIFARLGLGAYSFVLPRPIFALVRLTILWNAARPPVRWGLHLRRWRYMVGDSLTLFFANAVDMLTWQGDYILLGYFQSAQVLGIYFFAFNLSVQTLHLFTANLTGVLFPALSRIQDDPRRQTRAFLNAARLLAIIAVPLCILQAGLADPAMHLLFGAKWEKAIPVLQILSLGMAFRVVSSPAGSLMNAQGRFRTILLVSIANAALFLAMVWIGAGWYHGIASSWTTALAVAGYYAIVGPLFLFIAIEKSGGTWRDVISLYWPSMSASVVAVGLAVLAAGAIPMHGRALHVARFAIIGVLAVGMYLPLIRLLDPVGWRELTERVSGFYRRRFSAVAAG